MRIEIPEYKTLNIDTIFADFNGTLATVSYTHLDVYKRQCRSRRMMNIILLCRRLWMNWQNIISQRTGRVCIMI